MSSSSTPNRASKANIATISRFFFIFFLCSLICIGILYKLICTTTIHAEDWKLMGDSTLLDTAKIYPKRGDILASNGAILASDLNTYNIRIDFRANEFRIIEFSDSVEFIADSLAVIFPWRTKEQWVKHLNDGWQNKPKDKRSRGYSIAKKVSLLDANRVRKAPFFRGWKNSSYTGLVIEPVPTRTYPFGNMAKLSIGRVGQTAEDPTIIGRSGLERALDSLLYGVDGLRRKTVATRGTRMAIVRPAIDGYDVTTTIDITIQDLLEEELGQMILKSNAEWGTAMIMETATGDIKAMSNLERDTLSRTPRCIEGRNRLVERYEPGSVMKVMSMAVALEYGYAFPNKVDKVYPIEGGGYRYIVNRAIRDTHSPPSLPVSKFMEYSSNIGMVKMSMPEYEDNVNLFRQRLQELGFFDRLNSGMAYEKIPRIDILKQDKGGRLNLSRIIFGYSSQIPPLYTCAFYNAVANNGKFVRPRLVKKLHRQGLDSIIEVSYVREQMMSEENAKTLQKMMHDVVWGEHGTAQLVRDKTVEIAGKTGTCKIALEDKRPRVDANGDSIKLPPFKGGYREGHYRVTFCGFFPYENPKYTCIVVMNDPRGTLRGASASAGTVLKNVALKMNARGMLSDDPTYVAQNEAERPTLHATTNSKRNSAFNQATGISSIKVITPACDTIDTNKRIPDVCNINIREAIKKLEEAGYNVDFSGIGYVAKQTPAAGTPATPGTKVYLELRN